ncbi:hypothetical protein LCGC14_2519940, partial [marine sediment metagenome]
MDKIYDWRELNLQSLDIILCEGYGRLSKGIQVFQQLTGALPEYAKISHVAGIDELQDHNKWLWLQESTTLNKWANMRGVQRNPFNQWLYNYNGRVWVRKLHFGRTNGFYQKDGSFWGDNKDNDYESGIPGAVELILTGLMLHKYIRRVFPNFEPFRTTQVHCAELYAYRVAAHNLWIDGVVLNRLPPWLWCSWIDMRLRCEVGEMIRIK